MNFIKIMRCWFKGYDPGSLRRSDKSIRADISSYIIKHSTNSPMLFKPRHGFRLLTDTSRSCFPLPKSIGQYENIFWSIIQSTYTKPSIDKSFDLENSE